MIPENIRRNHERTDDCIATIAGLMDAYSIIQAERPDDTQDKVAQSAKSTLMFELMERIAQLLHLRSMEWAGLGGHGAGLGEAELIEARKGGGA